jgi:hypothetical protein
MTDVVWVSIVTAVSAIIVAAVARTSRKVTAVDQKATATLATVQQLEITVDGRLTNLLAATKEAAELAGRAAALAEYREEVSAAKAGEIAGWMSSGRAEGVAQERAAGAERAADVAVASAAVTADVAKVAKDEAEARTPVTDVS